MREQKTVTEKRFYEWHEDDVAATLRNRGAATEAVQKFWLSVLHGQMRSIV